MSIFSKTVKAFAIVALSLTCAVSAEDTLAGHTFYRSGAKDADTLSFGNDGTVVITASGQKTTGTYTVNDAETALLKVGGNEKELSYTPLSVMYDGCYVRKDVPLQREAVNALSGNRYDMYSFSGENQDQIFIVFGPDGKGILEMMLSESDSQLLGRKSVVAGTFSYVADVASHTVALLSEENSAYTIVFSYTPLALVLAGFLALPREGLSFNEKEAEEVAGHTYRGENDFFKAVTFKKDGSFTAVGEDVEESGSYFVNRAEHSVVIALPSGAILVHYDEKKIKLPTLGIELERE